MDPNEGESTHPMFEAYPRYEYHLASTQLVLAMLGMGFTLRPSDFAEVLRHPKGFIVGLLAVLVAGPCVALAVAKGFGLEAGIATGLVLVAAVPGGTLSNLLTYFAHGNVALSIALTGTATLGCLLTTPLVLRLAAGPFIEGEVVMPVGRIALEIVALLLLPLVVGMTVGSRSAQRRERLSRLFIRASLAVVIAMVIGAAGAGRVSAGEYGAAALLAMLGFAVTLAGLGFAASWLVRLPRRDGVAIGIEACYRNTSLAILIKASVFPAVPGVADPFADQIFFVALLYAGFALLVSLPPLLIHRRMAAPSAMSASA